MRFFQRSSFFLSDCVGLDEERLAAAGWWRCAGGLLKKSAHSGIILTWLFKYGIRLLQRAQ